MTLKLQQISRMMAVLLGSIFGVFYFMIGLHALVVLPEKHFWIGLVGTVAATLTLFPFSLLGAFRPKLAAYLILGSIVLVVAMLFLSL